MVYVYESVSVVCVCDSVSKGVRHPQLARRMLR